MKRTISLILALTLGMGWEVANADFIWGTPTNLGQPVNSPYGEAGVCISADGLEFYFTSARPAGHGGQDLWVMKRPTVEDGWGDPVNVGSPANSQYGYWEPSISSDGLTLYFSDGHTPQFGNRLPGGLGGQGDIWMITRETVQDAWGAPVNIGPAVNSQHASHPSISADGLSLYFQSHRPGSMAGHCDTMVARRESTSDSFASPVFLNNVNSADGEWMPDISADGLTLSFCRSNATLLWMATRATTDDDFGPPLKLPAQINVSPYLNNSPTLSADGSTLYFSSNRPGGVGGSDIWQVSISAIMDLNGDGIVDSADMCIMVDHWGEDYSACDIGPMPWGDGTVDVKDLIVLSEHLFEYVDDPTLIAHWAMDETDGMVVADSAGDNMGYALGEPLWQPDAGQVAGAIQLDGVDDYVMTPIAPDPDEGPFTVSAWVKGGAPGQVIISQPGSGANWLMADPAEANLMTELTNSTRSGGPLLSQTNITDGNWHRISLVWDGASRTLYVDGVAVAQDTQDGLEASGDGLYIGCGKNMQPGTHFSGLIDDVRIYDRAVEP